MNIVDRVLLARLGSNPNINVHHALVHARKDPARPVEVLVPLPYVSYTSAIGDDDNPRLAGRRQRRSVPFYLTYVGEDPEQAKAVGEAARELLERWLPTVEGHTMWPVKLEVSQRVRRDDDAVNPEGKPLFVGVDEYAVSMQLAPTPVH